MQLKVDNLEISNVSNMGTLNNSSNISQAIDTVLIERADRVKGKFHLVCFNLLESIEGRKAYDTETLCDILVTTLKVDPGIQVSELNHLGRRANTSSPSCSRPCPLHFKVNDWESKNILLRTGKYFRNSQDETLKQIYFIPDLAKNSKMRHISFMRKSDGVRNRGGKTFVLSVVKSLAMLKVLNQ